MTRRNYAYVQSGLDNVILVGLEVLEDDVGNSAITIKNVSGLHRAIIEAIGNKRAGLTGRELRFVRTELGLTQAELALVISKDVQTVGRWERGEFPIDPTADTVIRLMALQHVEKALPAVKDLATWTLLTLPEVPFLIDASDPDHWKPLQKQAA